MTDEEIKKEAGQAAWRLLFFWELVGLRYFNLLGEIDKILNQHKYAFEYAEYIQEINSASNLRRENRLLVKCVNDIKSLFENITDLPYSDIQEAINGRNQPQTSQPAPDHEESVPV